MTGVQTCALPISGDSITLNATDLLSQAKDEKSALRDELIKTLDELTYAKMTKLTAEMTEDAKKALTAAPLAIFVG